MGKPVQLITIIYFVIASIEVIAEVFVYTPLIIIFKPLIPLTLIVLYLAASETRNPLMVLALSLSLLTNLLFIPDTDEMLFYAIIAFLVHRVLVIYLIALLVKINDLVPMVIATIPFMLIFFYLFLITDEIPENSFFILIIQNLLIAVLGGIAVSSYVMSDNKASSWLLLCGLLFVLLQLIVFIERYYLSHLSPAILRPLAMGLNVFAFFALCQFVIVAERSDDNAAASD
ncbi:MAG: hypothetical protein ITG00_02870 [Flavobacterium sp.]|nr:hypothetical protein [Flavobacterium sp.]